MQPARGFGHVGRRAGVAEAHVAAAALGIEVDAGRGGDADVVEHLLGEGDAVGGEVADIDVEIEGAVGGHDRARARPWAARPAAARGSRRRRACWPPAPRCRRRRRWPRPGPRSAARCRGSGPAARSAAPAPRGTTSQPTRQPVIEKYLEKLLTTIALGAVGQRRLLGQAVGEAVVDLVGDQPDVVARGRPRRSRRAGSRSSMVPVGLAGLAITRPARPSRVAASSICAAVGIQREAASVSSSTGPGPSAVRICR